MDARRSSVVEAVDGAASAWVADGSNCVLRRELTPEEGTQRAEFAQRAKNRERNAWKKFDVYDPRPKGSVSKQIA